MKKKDKHNHKTKTNDMTIKDKGKLTIKNSSNQI